MIRGGGVGPGGQKKAHAATPRGGREDPRGGVSVSSRGGWGPAASEKRLRPRRAADVKIRGAVSASVRGGGGARGPCKAAAATPRRRREKPRPRGRHRAPGGPGPHRREKPGGPGAGPAPHIAAARGSPR